MKIAWRKRSRAKKSDPGENAEKIRIPDGADKTMPVIAVWADGHEKTISQMTVGEFNGTIEKPTQKRMPGKAKAKATTQTSSWKPFPDKTAQTAQGTTVTMFFRNNQPCDKSRPLERLVCLKESGKAQIVQMNIVAFKKAEDFGKPEDKTIIDYMNKACWDWVDRQMEAYMKGKTVDAIREDKRRHIVSMPAVQPTKRPNAQTGAEGGAGGETPAEQVEQPKPKKMPKGNGRETHCRAR